MEKQHYCLHVISVVLVWIIGLYQSGKFSVVRETWKNHRNWVQNGKTQKIAENSIFVTQNQKL